MATPNISHLTVLLQGLSARIKELDKEFETLYIKVELTLASWKNIEETFRLEGWDPRKRS